MKRTTIAMTALAASLCAAAPAAGATLTLEGSTYVFTAAPGETNYLHVRGDDDRPNEVFISDQNPLDISGTDCSREAWDGPEDARCQPRGGIRIALGDGDDKLYPSDPLPAGWALSADGGDGNDEVSAPTRGFPYTFLGGNGDDTMKGGAGADVLDGGEGRDTIDGGEGPDQLRGGGGDDTLHPGDWSSTAADVIDGGPGQDKLDGAWTQRDRGDNDPVSVTLDGVANDGHAGEGDNVIGIEHVKVTRPGTFVAGADPVIFDIWNLGAGNSSVKGSPGADDIRTWDLEDTIDGGAGDDKIEGGNGNDTITGGPGKDRILADADAGSCNFLVCRLPFGNDTVNARDGEVDSIDCGIGTDTAIVDADDVVANCENVDRGPTGGGGPNGGKGCKVPKVKKGAKLKAARKSLKKAGCAAKTRKLRSSVKRGRVVKVAPKAGKRVAAGKKVTVYVSKGRR
jgi:hypothetical protein